jgi:pyridoxal phosphate enzyme (YggS family)
MTTSIAENFSVVKQRINVAAARAGRDPSEIKLITVTKGFSVPRIVEAVEAGADALGENRAAEAAEKFEILGRVVEGRSISWHFLGYLQTNKVKYVIGFADFIHSVDRISLAEEIDKRARALGKKQPVLIEVNVSGEPSKAGLKPAEVTGFVEGLGRFQNLEAKGLMTIAPLADDPELARPVFAGLRETFERTRAATGLTELKELSMGMTDDYEVAIEEGATIVRIGRAVMGPRPAG